jgi:hypothetical protein
MLASTDESTRRQDPEEQHHHPHCRGNLKLPLLGSHSFQRKIKIFASFHLCFKLKKTAITREVKDQ